ncbi:MAG TPA: signal peptidase II [Cellulomonas sp.]
MPSEPTDETRGESTVGVDGPMGVGGASPGGQARLVRAVVAITLVVLAVDQLTKWRALARLVPGERIDLVGSLLGLELVFNPGAALSIATGMTWVLTVIAALVVVVVARASRRLGSRLWTLAFGLLLGGALGNLVDRFFRPPAPARGHVVDFIAYGNWFVGNVADIAIVVAAALVVLQTLRGVRLDGTREPRRVDAEPAPAPDEGARPAEPGGR